MVFVAAHAMGFHAYAQRQWANLATAECLILTNLQKKLKGGHFSFYRFGFHPVTKEYKVAHFLGEHQNNYSQGTFNVIKVYTLGKYYGEMF